MNPLAIAGCQALEVFTAVDECLLLSSNLPFFPHYVNFSISLSSIEHNFILEMVLARSETLMAKESLQEQMINVTASDVALQFVG